MRAVGVAGAGTMGAGIAALAAEASLRTLLYDPDPAALARAPDGVEPVRDLGAFAACGLVVEAAPEDIEVKRALFERLAEIVEPDCVLATNTSSLSVTALAAGLPHPERVVGMHFFNPPAKMRLVEVVAGEVSSRDALTVAREAGEAMGKHVIEAADGPGFVVNRCNRPFGLEALRLVQDGVATPEQVDRVCRMAGGFRMGPFELMDLVGLDVGLAVSRSFHEQSFGEPRWRPSPLVARRVAAGHLGRKAGRGWYEYPPGRPADPEPPEPGGGSGLVIIAGEGTVAGELWAAAEDAGWDVAEPAEAEGALAELILDCGAEDDDLPLQGGPQAILCDEGALGALDPGGATAGFHLVPPLGRLVELTAQPTTAPAALAAAERFFATLGFHAERVGDAPGLVLGRIVAQLVNEAYFALGERVATAEDIDAGMELGLNHPRGPLAWGELWGRDAVLAVLAGLQAEYGEERWRPAPALVRAYRHDEAH
ncbi:MAG TPA: 3-hydroxyacyl-CoA dehydrogenase family protein [Solirubrobacteraceae bacterium]|nr:3-hydroxyacyl-CoA dehydrogenase family protein [Solirubrobacteraceae bacterium]